MAGKAAEGGHVVPGSDRILFRDWSAMCAALTPKRYERLRALRQTPETGLRALARALDRDVKRVHGDVVALAELEIVVRGANGSVSSESDEIISTSRIAA